MSSRLAAALTLALATLTSAPAAARADTLVIVDPDAAWRDAVEAALAPWGIGVETVSANAASGSPSARGAALILRTGGALAVWLEPDGTGSVLWIYDASTRSALGRPVHVAPPFDAPTAAALALSLKTILRRRLPRGERSAPTPSSERRSVSATPVPLADAWSLELSSGARFSATRPDRAEHRVALRATFWPGSVGRHLGVGLQLAGGPGVEHAGGGLDARWVDTSAELVIEGRLRLEIVELGLRIGGGAHVTQLSGSLTQVEHDVDAWRVNPSASAGVSVGLRLTERLWLGLRVETDVPIIAQRYRLADESVLEVARGSLGVLLGAEIGLE